MKWKVNSNETKYDLQDNDLGVCIYKPDNLEGWFLSCHKLPMVHFAKNIYTNNEISKY